MGKYDNIPEHARTGPKRYAVNTANGLTAYLVDSINGQPGLYASRISSEGRYRKGETVTDILGHSRTFGGKWLPGLNVGLPDVFIICDGKFIGVEIKIGRDKMSDVQIKIKNKLIDAGARYFVISTKETADELIKILTGK